MEEQKNELEIEIAKENITRPTLDRDQIEFWFPCFRKVDASKSENRRRLVDSFVNSVILYDDRIEFYFNFKKGAKTLSLTDLEKGSDMLDSLPAQTRINSLCGDMLELFFNCGKIFFLLPLSGNSDRLQIELRNHIFHGNIARQIPIGTIQRRVYIHMAKYAVHHNVQIIPNRNFRCEAIIFKYMARIIKNISAIC